MPDRPVSVIFALDVEDNAAVFENACASVHPALSVQSTGHDVHQSIYPKNSAPLTPSSHTHALRAWNVFSRICPAKTTGINR